jgi:hypothetical protein
MWRFVAALSTPGAATFAWAAIALSSPFLFNTFTVYPEIVAALAVVVAFTLAVNLDAGPRASARWAIVGVCCAALPWLSTKYAPMSAVLIAISLLRMYRRDRWTHAAILVTPYALSLVAWLYFFYAFWGIPLPMAPYGTMVQTHPRNLVFGAPGLLFDQEYGVLAYAPVYALAISGLLAMWAAGGETRRRAIEIVLTFGALLGTVGAFRIWWGGTASPGRPLASGLLLLALPIAIATRRGAAAGPRRAGHYLLLTVTIGVAITLAVAQQGLLINNGRDGTSDLLAYWSPYWAAWSAAPTFIFHEAPTAWMHTIVWLGTAAFAAVLLSRWRARTPGAAALAAMAVLAGGVVLATIVVPALPHDPPQPKAELMARSHAPVLDQFDRAVRPHAIVFDPLRLESADQVRPLATLEVIPGLHLRPQPLRVLHNGRFSLPAGSYRADFEWVDSTQPSTIALQIGRMGEPLQSWPVQPQRGTHWQADFELPLDMNFVAFRGTTDLERAIKRIVISPLFVTNESERPKTATVLAARRYGSVTVFTHSLAAEPERQGFWVVGRRHAEVTFVRNPDQTPLQLRVHSGPQPNRVQFATAGWNTTLDLEPDKKMIVTVPVSMPIVTLDMYAENGFDPRKYEQGSTDTRLLGVWVEVYIGEE